MSTLDSTHIVHVAQPVGVRLFRVQMASLIVLYTVLVYGGIFLLTRTLLLDSVHNQAASYASLVLDTRSWNASHEGVWVLKSSDSPSNPYLTQLGVSPDIHAEDGTTLTLRDHATMTREISEVSSTQGRVRFHLTSLDYINPANAPDSWERTALERIGAGEASVSGVNTDGGVRTYRLASALTVDAGCLKCHSAQGYEIGDNRGAVTISISMRDTDAQMRLTGVALTGFGGLTLALSLLALSYLTSKMQQRIEEANVQLAHAAITDTLTGSLNRGATYARLAEEFERARREEQPLSVIMLDLDNFKRINDTYGHATGDCALREFVGSVKASVRAYDIVGRIGGEEFLIVSPGTDSHTAYGLAFRVLDGIRSSPLVCKVGLTITASAGVADMTASDESIDTLIGRADAALYRAKDNGRDRVETA